MTIEDKIQKEIAAKYKLTKEQVESIVKIQGELIAKTFQELERKPIRLPYFGLFKVKPGRAYYLDKNNKKDERTN
jgi:nucleoid DNA-binding protein